MKKKSHNLLVKIIFGFACFCLCGCLIFSLCGLKVNAASDNQNNNNEQETQEEETPPDRMATANSFRQISMGSNSANRKLELYIMCTRDFLDTTATQQLFYAGYGAQNFSFQLNAGYIQLLSTISNTTTLLANQDITTYLQENDCIYITTEYTQYTNSNYYYNINISIYRVINGAWNVYSTFYNGEISSGTATIGYIFNNMLYYFMNHRAAETVTFNQNIVFSAVSTTNDTVFPNLTGHTWYIYKELSSLWTTGGYPQLFTIYGTNHTFNYSLDVTNSKILQYVDDDPAPFEINYSKNDIIGLKYNGTGNVELLTYRIDHDLNAENEIISSTYFTQNTQTLNTLTNVEKIEFHNGFMGKYAPGTSTTIPSYYLNDVIATINTMQYNYGYQEGVEGENVFSPVWNILSGVFSVVASVMSIELVPHITIGVFFLIPLFFAVLGLILWIWKGKN